MKTDVRFNINIRLKKLEFNNHNIHCDSEYLTVVYRNMKNRSFPLYQLFSVVQVLLCEVLGNI